MEKYLNILDGTIIIMLGAILAGIVHAVPTII